MSTISEEDHIQFLAAASYFLPETTNLSFTRTSGGVNNLVLYVNDAPPHKQWILRIYNNGCNHDMVAFEHAILDQLAAQPLSFQVPRYLPPIAAESTKETFVLLPNGSMACMCESIQGVSPGNQYVKQLGSASGELVAALAKVNLSPPSPTRPIYDLWHVHHAVQRASFFTSLRSSAFDSVRPAAHFMETQIVSMEVQIHNFLQRGLPMQWIHGDMHYDNALVHQGQITGLLDFEFCAWDFRAMDLAIMLSKYTGELDPLPKIDEFIMGFATFVTLTEAEIEAVPQLIKLRVLSNVIYFVGRALAKEDSYDQLISRIENYQKRCLWIDQMRTRLIEIFIARFTTIESRRF